MDFGWITIPDEVYHHSLEYRYCMTSSGLKNMAQSPAHWLSNRTTPPGDPTAALHFGSAFHGYMLDTHVIETPEKKITLPKLLELERELGPKSETLYVNPDDYNHLEAMKQVLLENELAEKLINHPSAIIEKAGIFADPDYNIIGTIKPDIRIPDLGIIVDLKTTTDASAWSFPRSIRRFKYDWQAWWYLRGANQLSHEYYDTFIIIAIEKLPPYGINLFQIVEGLYYADMQIRPLLDSFADCIAADMWPCYPADEVIEI